MRDDTIEAAIVAVMALALATITVLRLLVVPLLALVVVLLTPRRRPAPQPAPVASQPALPPVSLATIAAGLMELPAAQLRALAGTRRRCSKAELTALICAMPV